MDKEEMSAFYRMICAATDAELERTILSLLAVTSTFREQQTRSDARWMISTARKELAARRNVLPEDFPAIPRAVRDDSDA